MKAIVFGFGIFCPSTRDVVLGEACCIRQLTTWTEVKP